MKHKHHIIPEHAGGTDDPSNLIEVTVEEHAFIHKELWEKQGRWQDYVAWQGLSGQIGREEIIRLIQINANKGKKASAETRRKQSESHKGKTQSIDTIEKRRKKLIGQVRNFQDKETWKQNLSDSLTGRKPSFEGRLHTEESKEKNRKSKMGHTYNKGRKFEKIDCPKCGKTVSMNRLSVHQNGVKCK